MSDQPTRGLILAGVDSQAAGLAEMRAELIGRMDRLDQRIDGLYAELAVMRGELMAHLDGIRADIARSRP